MTRRPRWAAAVPAVLVVVAAAAATGSAVAAGDDSMSSAAAAPSTAAETAGTGDTTEPATESTPAASPTAFQDFGPSGEVATDEPLPADSGGTGVSLSYAEWTPGVGVQAAGFIAGVVESGGVCTLSLTRSGATEQVTLDAEPDATITGCGPLVVPGDQLGPGDWEVVLRYRSASSRGESAPAIVTVPN
jgi:hypothetical protein